MARVEELPGHELFNAGVADLRAGRRSQPALLVSLIRTRLIQAGLEVPETNAERPSHELYGLLVAESPDTAYGRYNALLRRIVSFARAAENATAR
jgi:hypothetical protein